MTSTLANKDNKETNNHRLARLKTQQQLCSKLLMECLSLLEVYPGHTERLKSVMSQVENMMAQNNRVIARIENLT